MTGQEVQLKRRWMGRLDYDADLLMQLTQFCIDHAITLGRVEAIGAVKKARIGYYDQQDRSYSYMDLERPLEILALKGNISLKDDQPFVHAHITLSDEHGSAFGGHLAEGTVVFAGEFILDQYTGPSLTRTPDTSTGLSLWGRSI